MARLYRRRDRPADLFYWADFEDEAGKRQRVRVSPNKRDAQEFLARKLADVAARKLLPHHAAGEKRLKEWAEYYVTHVASTLRWRRDVERILRAWMEHLGDCRLRDITPAMIQARLTERRRTMTPATTNRDRAVLHRLLAVAVQHGELDRNPCQAIRPLRERNARTRFLSEEEACRLVNACSGSLRDIVLVLLNTGGRKGEVLNLRRQDVDFASKTITFADTKNGSVRKVPMNNVVIDVLRRLKRQGEFVFMNGGRRVIHIEHPFKTACRRAGLKDVTLHTLRHTFISHATMAGVDPRTIAQIVGHRTMTMVLRYSHLSAEHATRAVDRVRLGGADRVGEGGSPGIVPFHAARTGLDRARQAAVPRARGRQAAR